MAAGLTDQVWTFRELLTAKFEPMHNPSGSEWVSKRRYWVYCGHGSWASGEHAWHL